MNPPNETASPASAHHRMTASFDRFNRVVTSRTYTLYLSPSRSSEKTKAAVSSLTNVYFVVWIEFRFFGCIIIIIFFPLFCQSCAFATDMKTF